MTIAIVIIVLIIALLWYLKSRQDNGANPRANASRRHKRVRSPGKKAAGADLTPRPHAAVSIKFSDGACPAVRAIRKKRFLASEAPSMPLPECTSSRCSCTYVHFKDRRAPMGERRALGSMRTDLHSSGGDKERREKRGRRTTD